MKVREMEAGMRFPSATSFESAHIYIGQFPLPGGDDGEVVVVFLSPGFMGVRPSVYSATAFAEEEVPNNPLPDSDVRRARILAGAADAIRRL